MAMVLSTLESSQPPAMVRMHRAWTIPCMTISAVGLGFLGAAMA